MYDIVFGSVFPIRRRGAAESIPVEARNLNVHLERRAICSSCADRAVPVGSMVLLRLAWRQVIRPLPRPDVVRRVGSVPIGAIAY